MFSKSATCKPASPAKASNPKMEIKTEQNDPSNQEEKRIFRDRKDTNT